MLLSPLAMTVILFVAVWSGTAVAARMIARPARALTATRLRRKHLDGRALTGRKRMPGNDGDSLLDQLFDIAQEGTLLAVAKRDGGTVGAGARCGICCRGSPQRRYGAWRGPRQLCWRRAWCG